MQSDQRCVDFRAVLGGRACQARSFAHSLCCLPTVCAHVAVCLTCLAIAPCIPIGQGHKDFGAVVAVSDHKDPACAHRLLGDAQLRALLLQRRIFGARRLGTLCDCASFSLVLLVAACAVPSTSRRAALNVLLSCFCIKSKAVTTAQQAYTWRTWS